MTEDMCENIDLFDAAEMMRRQLRQSRVVLPQLLTNSALERMNEGVCSQLELKIAE